MKKKEARREGYKLEAGKRVSRRCKRETSLKSKEAGTYTDSKDGSGTNQFVYVS